MIASLINLLPFAAEALPKLTIGEQGGWTITIVGVLIVFCALYVLVCIFRLIPFFLQLSAKKKTKNEPVAAAEPVKVEEAPVSDDVNVAIAMAIHMYLNEMHDDESGVITIQSEPTAWNSKIWNMENRSFQ